MRSRWRRSASSTPSADSWIAHVYAGPGHVRLNHLEGPTLLSIVFPRTWRRLRVANNPFGPEPLLSHSAPHYQRRELGWRPSSLLEFAWCRRRDLNPHGFPRHPSRGSCLYGVYSPVGFRRKSPYPPDSNLQPPDQEIPGRVSNFNDFSGLKGSNRVRTGQTEPQNAPLSFLSY